MDAKLTRRVAPAVLCLAVMWVPAGTAVVTDMAKPGTPHEGTASSGPSTARRMLPIRTLHPSSQIGSSVAEFDMTPPTRQTLNGRTPNLLDVEWYGSEQAIEQPGPVKTPRPVTTDQFVQAQSSRPAIHKLHKSSRVS